MPVVGGMGVPSLSEVRAWDVTHLESAAKGWTATAEHWESAFASIHRMSVAPGGTAWEGSAAEAAQERAFADLVKVRGLADVLHESAAIARRGAETLHSVKASVLDAVEKANSAGYIVGEDLSVTPTRRDVLAQAQAKVYAADIQERVAQLVAHDKEIAAKINSATAPLEEVSFAEGPGEAPQPTPKNDHIQAVDHTWANSPPPALTDGPDGDDIRRVLDKLPEGERSSIREVRTPQDLENLWNWARQHGVEIPNGYGDPNKGVLYQLPDGTRIGQRWVAGSNGKPVLDINIPGQGGYTKVHINPRGGVPDIPGFGGADVDFGGNDISSSGGADVDFGGNDISSSGGADVDFGGNDISSSGGADVDFSGEPPGPPVTGIEGHS